MHIARLSNGISEKLQPSATAVFQLKKPKTAFHKTYNSPNKALALRVYLGQLRLLLFVRKNRKPSQMGGFP